MILEQRCPLCGGVLVLRWTLETVLPMPLVGGSSMKLVVREHPYVVCVGWCGLVERGETT